MPPGQTRGSSGSSGGLTILGTSAQLLPASRGQALALLSPHPWESHLVPPRASLCPAHPGGGMSLAVGAPVLGAPETSPLKRFCYSWSPGAGRLGPVWLRGDPIRC